jgi:hypothetical protein
VVHGGRYRTRDLDRSPPIRRQASSKKKPIFPCARGACVWKARRHWGRRQVWLRPDSAANQWMEHTPAGRAAPMWMWVLEALCLVGLLRRRLSVSLRGGAGAVVASANHSDMLPSARLVTRSTSPRLHTYIYIYIMFMLSLCPSPTNVPRKKKGLSGQFLISTARRSTVGRRIHRGGRCQAATR